VNSSANQQHSYKEWMPAYYRVFLCALSNRNIWFLPLVFLLVTSIRLGVHEHPDNDPNLPEEQRWDINFEPIEAMLWRTFAMTTAWEIDDQMADSFQSIANEVLLHNPNYEVGRLQFLVEQSLQKNGAEVAELLARFLPYQEERNQSIAALRDAKPKEQREMLLRLKNGLIERQVHYFGEDLAQVLFTSKNKATLFNIDRQIILVDSNLTTEQKRNKLTQSAVTQQQAITVP